jgi:hypothetical protein
MTDYWKEPARVEVAGLTWRISTNHERLPDEATTTTVKKDATFASF